MLLENCISAQPDYYVDATVPFYRSGGYFIKLLQWVHGVVPLADGLAVYLSRIR